MSAVPCPIDGCDLPARSGYMCGACQAELKRAEQAERERDTAREALDAAAIVIASLRDQRDEQRQRAENAERQREQALNAIADERRGRLAAEAAVRRAREIHRRHDCARHVNPRTPVPCVNEGLCDGCAARYPCQTATALDAEQPKETP